MEKGKTTRYFKYAIGEIILVVIGILIALQINNWNEQKKENKLVGVYLKKIIKDLESDTLRFSSNFKDTELRIEYGKEVMLILDSLSLETDFRNLLLKMQSTARINFPKIAKNTFLDLQNSGNLKLLRNDSVVEALRDYYLEDMDFWKQSYVKITVEGLLPEVTSIIPFNLQESILEDEYSRNLSIRALKRDWYYDSLTFDLSNIEKIKIINAITNNDELNSHLKIATRAHILQRRYGRDTKNSAKELILLLKQIIKKDD